MKFKKKRKKKAIHPPLKIKKIKKSNKTLKNNLTKKNKILKTKIRTNKVIKLSKIQM